MKPELYFDINSENSGGSLYRVTQPDGHKSFLYQHSTYDEHTDDTKIFQTTYNSFDAFWQELIKDKLWFYKHPLFVHPEQRAFIQEQLKKVNWKIQGDVKWQASHQRQWTKVLNAGTDYYSPPTAR